MTRTTSMDLLKVLPHSNVAVRSPALASTFRLGRGGRLQRSKGLGLLVCVTLGVSSVARAGEPPGRGEPADSATPIGTDSRIGDGHDIGTADPTLVERVAPRGEWMVICQDRDAHGQDEFVGRHGEMFEGRLRPYLVVKTGSGIPFDTFIASDPTGRFVALQKGDDLFLVDAKANTQTKIPGADLRGYDARIVSRHVIDFDARGKMMLYLRRTGGERRVVVRTLATGDESELRIGRREIWKAYIGGDGKWIVLDALPDDNWPTELSDAAPPTCRGPVGTSIVISGGRPSNVARLWAKIGDERVRDIAGLIRPYGDGVLLRDPDGSLKIERGGVRSEVVPSSCHGRVVHSDPGGGRIAVVCMDGNGRSGTLTIFENGNRNEVSSVPAPKRDIVNDLPTDEFEWMGQVFDGRQHRMNGRTTIQSDEVILKAVDGGIRGVFAVRGDGAELRSTNSPRLLKGARAPLPRGPLQWFRDVRAGY